MKKSLLIQRYNDGDITETEMDELFKLRQEDPSIEAEILLDQEVNNAIAHNQLITNLNSFHAELYG